MVTRTKAVLTLSGAALSIVAFAATTQTGNAAPRTSPALAAAHQRLTFTALDADRTERFIRATPSGGLGDQFVEHELLRGGHGQLLGEVAGVCETVSAPDDAVPPALAQCTFTYLLPKGQITTQGLVPRAQFQHYVLAVTGGTGRYVTARGQATTVLSAPENHDNTITITLR